MAREPIVFYYMGNMKHHNFLTKKLTAKKIVIAISLVVFAGCIKATPAGVDSGGSVLLSECTLNTASTGTCKISTVGTIPTTTFGSNIASYSNPTATTSITASIPNGFYSSKSVSFTDLFLLPANIKSGITIFGVTGTSAGNASNAHRDLAGTQLSAAAEASTYAGIALPATGGYTYRDVPKISKDDDGTTGGSVSYVNRTSWTGLVCGTSGTLDQRITNCAGVLGSTATWTGEANGNGGQGNWKIVTRSGDCTSTAPNRVCKEVWRDENTQLLWSSKVSEAINWCKSSGSNNIGGNPSAEDDLQNFCDNASYQAVVVQAISACHDDNSVNFINTDASLTNTAGKGALNKSSTPAVAWRLPTRADYQQANNDGMRFVLPDAGSKISGATSTYEWTSSVLSTSRASAWIFDSYLGYFATNSRELTTYSGTNVGVRCIGR